MDLENKIKQKLIIRGFTEKQLLNNRGLIGATIDEVALMLVKNLAIHGVSNSYSKEDLRVAFEQARCNKHSFDDWYEFNYC